MCTGEGNGNPFLFPCLEHPVDRGAWWAAVHRVAQSLPRLKRLSSSCSVHTHAVSTHIYTYMCVRTRVYICTHMCAHIYTCVQYTCTYTRVCTYTHACVHIHIHMCTNIHAHVYTYMCAYIHVRVCTYTRVCAIHMYIYTRVCTYTHTCVHIHIHVYKYTRTRVHLHACIYTRTCVYAATSVVSDSLHPMD